MKKAILLALALTMPTAALAAGSDSDDAPKPTNTTKECKDGKVWDDEKQECLDAESNLINDDVRYKAVRELAYAARYDDALKVLASMSDQSESRVLTYYGFINRRSGDVELGMKYYDQALATDPDNLLARSYMGQGLVEQGKIEEAKIQLLEINQRGGKDSWPEIALARSIERGVGYSY